MVLCIGRLSCVLLENIAGSFFRWCSRRSGNLPFPPHWCTQNSCSARFPCPAFKLLVPSIAKPYSHGLLIDPLCWLVMAHCTIKLLVHVLEFPQGVARNKRMVHTWPDQPWRSIWLDSHALTQVLNFPHDTNTSTSYRMAKLPHVQYVQHISPGIINA